VSALYAVSSRPDARARPVSALIPTPSSNRRFIEW
jgi:hypothetical protein